MTDDLEDRMWAALDSVHDQDVTLTDYAKACAAVARDMCRTQWDNEMCLRFAQGYDREDAAQRGEIDPHSDQDASYAEWAAARVSCVRSGLAAVVLGAIKDRAAALSQKGGDA